VVKFNNFKLTINNIDTYIYLIRDGEEITLKYIGITKTTIKERLRQHKDRTFVDLKILNMQ